MNNMFSTSEANPKSSLFNLPAIGFISFFICVPAIVFVCSNFTNFFDPVLEWLSLSRIAAHDSISSTALPLNEHGHDLLEWISITIAFLTFALATFRYFIVGGIAAPFIGVALCYSGLSDVIHVLAYNNVFSKTDLGVQQTLLTWTLGRVGFLSILLVGAFTFLKWKKKGVPRPYIIQKVLRSCGLTAIIFLVCEVALTFAHELPRALYNGPISRPYELLPLTLGIASLFVFRRVHKIKQNFFSHALVLMIIPFIASEIYLLVSESQFSGLNQAFAHWNKILCYLVPFIGLSLDYGESQKLYAKARAHLEHSEQLYRGIVQNTEEGIVVIGPDRKITFANQKYAGFFGTTSEAIAGTDISLLVPLEQRAFFDERLNRRRAGFKEQYEYQYKDRNGKLRYYLSSGTPLYDENGKYIGALAVISDVTERTESQKLIAEQNHRIAAAAKMSALGQMAAGIAHEINNPLAIIHAKSDLLVESSEGKNVDLELIKDSSLKIRATAERIAKIVKGLRTFTRSSEEDPLTPVDINKIIDESISFCEGRLKRHSIQLYTPKKRGGISIFCRPTEISQVLVNLLNNAVDAVSVLTEKWICIELEEYENKIVVSVEDSGPGIPETIRTKLFQPFFTTKAAGDGTGLGLNISAGIVKGHKGSMEIDSSSPNTRFVITLPKHQSSQLPKAS